jgi:hypothetical protein
MKEKLQIIVMTLVGVAVILGVIFYILGSQNIELSDLALIIIPFILVVATLALIWDKIKNIRRGLPSEDERAKKLHWKAGAYTYYSTIWIAVGIMWYNIFAENLNLYVLTAIQVIAAIILLSALCFFAFNFYFMRKGDI